MRFVDNSNNDNALFEMANLFPIVVNTIANFK